MLHQIVHEKPHQIDAEKNDEIGRQLIEIKKVISSVDAVCDVWNMSAYARGQNDAMFASRSARENITEQKQTLMETRGGTNEGEIKRMMRLR